MKKNASLLLVVLLVTSCSSRPNTNPSDNRSVPVNVVSPIVRDVSFFVETIGTLQPKACAEIFPQTDGYIAEIHVKEGQCVKKGDPLFSLDQTVHKIRVQKAQAQLNMEVAAFQGFQKKMERYESLAKKDLIAQNEWDELQTQLDRARSSIDLHTAELENAQIELERCILKSPIDGRVGKIPHSEGVFVKNMTTVLTNISQVDSLLFECLITEKEFFEIPRTTQHVTVSPLSTSGVTRTGMLTFFDSSFDTSRGVLLVRGLITNPDDEARLLPGQVVRIQIPTRTETSVMLIPQKAIKYNQEGPYVYTVTPEMKATICQIDVGEEQGTNRIVQKGLDPQDCIIVDGHLRLSDGCTVRIHEQPSLG